MIPTPTLRKILYMYYSGEAIAYIALMIKRSENAVDSLLTDLKIPKRPAGAFSGKRRDEWLAQRHVKALRRMFND